MAENGSEMMDLAEAAAGDCTIHFEDGRFMGQSWFELVGEGAKLLEDLIDRYGDYGFVEFNRQFTLLLEEQLESQISTHDEKLQALLPRVSGAPYSASEIRELEDRGANTSTLVTTKDYRATQGVRCAYSEFLRRYRDGQPMEVYIPTEKPIAFRSKAIREPWAVGRFPNGKKTILQKPKV